MTHRKPRIGEVLQFKLPDGNYAFGRMLREGAVAFYRVTSEVAGDAPIGSGDYQFVAALYRDVVRSDEVPIVGFDPTVFNGDDWPLAQSVRDPITGDMQIYERGQMRPSSPDECVGLEPAAVWDLNHIIDRLMGFGNFWVSGVRE